jgi:manganese transport protein
MLLEKIKKFFSEKDNPKLGGLEILKFIGPGLLVTVGFIDPGNWASNVAAGSYYGYALLWMVTLSTIMLIVLQHDVAHIGIKTGLCLSEAATQYTKPWISKTILSSAVIAAIATALAEILGGAIALNMLFKLPLKIGAILVSIFVVWMVFTNAYKRLEKIIIGFVSLIGLSFLIELLLVKNLQWNQAFAGWVTPSMPPGSIAIIMSVLGAVVMPHNLFLHSEIIQSRQWNLEDEAVMERQLKYEFTDTLISMIIGWAINSAIILIAAATFFHNSIKVDDLAQAESMLRPLLGNSAAVIFAFALLCSGLASCVTASMAGGSIFAGMFKEPYDIEDKHTKIGIAITIVFAVIAIFFIKDPFQGLIYSQVFLSMQLPWTIFLQIYLSSSKRVMGKFANTTKEKIMLWAIALIVTYMNVLLLISFARSFKIL